MGVALEGWHAILGECRNYAPPACSLTFSFWQDLALSSFLYISGTKPLGALHWASARAGLAQVPCGLNKKWAKLIFPKLFLDLLGDLDKWF